MPLTLVTGPANAAKARVVLDAYRAAIARDPILVVPTFGDVEHYRRELAEEGVVFGARVMRFGWLIDAIGRRAGVRPRALGVLARERAAAAAVANTDLDRLAQAAATPGFARALVRFVSELEQARIDPPRFTRAVRQWGGGGPYAQELAALYAAYRRVLERCECVDSDLAAVMALDALRNDPARWGATPVFLYGFDDLTAPQLDAVDTLANRAEAEVWFSLTFEPGRDATAARATTREQLIALGAQEQRLDALPDYYDAPALHHVERGLFVAGADRVAADGAVVLLEGGGERAEAELVAAHVGRLLARGTAPDHIAVVHARLRDVAPLLAQVFDGYGIPVALHRTIAAGHTALGRGLVAALRCALLNGSADDLLTYLRTPGLLDVPALADRLEAEVRREGLRSADEARAAWERERWPLDALDALRSAAERSPAALCRRLADEAATLLARPHTRQAAVLEGPEGIDARVAARVRSALRELGDAPPPLQPSPAELATILDELDVHLGEDPGPGRVTVTTPLALRARRVRALFCMGMQESVFPAPGRPEPFLGDAQRRALNVSAGLGLRLHEDALGAERHLFYLAVSRPTELLALAWRSADDDGRPVVRSLFVDDVADLLADAPAPARRALGEAGWADEAPSAAEAARAAAAAAPASAAAPIEPLRHPDVLAALHARETWSASGLELWTSCPVKWFVERLLDPEGLVPDPEPMLRGLVAHRVLEQTVRRIEGPLTPAVLPVARQLLHEALEEHAGSVRISVNPQRLRSAVRRLEVDLVRYLDHAANAGSAFVPDRFELSFGGAGDELPALELFGGELRLQGRIDRLDRGPDGTEVIVYDYKGRSAPAWPKWGPPPDGTGKLQVALYMLAVRHLLGAEPVGGLYQPLGAEDSRARGLVRTDADPGLVTVNGDRVAPEHVEEVLAVCAEAARDAVEEIRAGALVPRPDSCFWKGGCSYPSICRCEAADR